MSVLYSPSTSRLRWAEAPAGGGELRAGPSTGGAGGEQSHDSASQERFHFCPEGRHQHKIKFPCCWFRRDNDYFKKLHFYLNDLCAFGVISSIATVWHYEKVWEIFQTRLYLLCRHPPSQTHYCATHWTKTGQIPHLNETTRIKRVAFSLIVLSFNTITFTGFM